MAEIVSELIRRFTAFSVAAVEKSVIRAIFVYPFRVSRQQRDTAIQHLYGKERSMADFEKRMLLALAIATVVMLLNIVAVTSGSADGYYAQITAWLRNLAG